VLMIDYELLFDNSMFLRSVFLAPVFFKEVYNFS